MCALSQGYQRCAWPCAASCWSAPELGLTGDTVLPVLPVMQPPPRCSRSAQPSLLIARADPDPDNLRGACWLQSWVETAARTCLWAACGLPATTALPAAGALLRCTCTAGGPMCSGPAAAAASLLGLRSVQHALGGRVGSMPHQGDGRWRAVCQALWQCRATASVQPRAHVWVELVGRACGMKPARPPSRVHPCYPGGTLAPLILTTRRF